MKKNLIIGRDPQSDIVIPDSRDVVSRCHAVLYIDGNRMQIEDRSKNGTYVNGLRINPGIRVPVSRKDSISFAHIAELDWSKIPNPSKKLWIIAIIALVVVLLGVLSILHRETIKGWFNCEPEVVYSTDTLRLTDTVTIEKTIEKIVVKSSPAKDTASTKTPEAAVPPTKEENVPIF